jgi:hypothetical protein
MTRASLLGSEGRRAARAFRAGLLLGVLVMAGCKRAPDNEAANRASFVVQQSFAADAGMAWRLTTNDEVFFDDGWNPMETTPRDGVHGEAWRWMGRTALIRLRTHTRPMILEITGRVPMHLLGATPMMTFRWRGNRVDAFLAPVGSFTKKIAVTPAMQAGTTLADFTVETSSWASERDDPRELGFALEGVRWEAAKD